jgi:uncharacterized tellurite resistance protein B-like protein
MPDLREIEERVLANGRVDGHDVEVLRRVLYADGKIDRKEADFLAELHKRAQYRTRGFEQFFYQAIKDHILANGRIGPRKTAWLRQLLLADGKIDDEERNFVRQIKGEAKEVSPEFEALFKECMKQPPEQHTSGG